MPPLGPPFAELTGANGSPITLYQEDCVTGLSNRLDRGSVDVVVTSPPYNLGVGYGVYNDHRPRTEYLEWIGKFTDSVEGVLSDSGSFFLNVGGSPKNPFWPWEIAGTIGRRFVLQNVIHWVKSIAIDRDSVGRSAGLSRDLAVGHYKPVTSRRYLHGAHEYIFHFTRRGDVVLDREAAGVPYMDRSNVDRWNRTATDRRCRGDTWFLPYETIRLRSKDRPHPATFPSALPERCLILHGLSRVRRCVDPFVGIGSTAVAAAKLGVPFVGFDVDESYLAVARQRVEEMGGTGRIPVARTTVPSPSRRAGHSSSK